MVKATINNYSIKSLGYRQFSQRIPNKKIRQLNIEKQEIKTYWRKIYGNFKSNKARIYYI